MQDSFIGTQHHRDTINRVPETTTDQDGFIADEGVVNHASVEVQQSFGEQAVRSWCDSDVFRRRADRRTRGTACRWIVLAATGPGFAGSELFGHGDYVAAVIAGGGDGAGGAADGADRFPWRARGRMCGDG